MQKIHSPADNNNEYSTHNRRRFIEKGMMVTIATGIIAGTGFLLTGCKENEEEKEVSPPEDLMQEHGVLNRILLIYDHCRTQLVNKQSFSSAAISDSVAQRYILP